LNGLFLFCHFKKIILLNLFTHWFDGQSLLRKEIRFVMASWSSQKLVTKKTFDVVLVCDVNSGHAAVLIVGGEFGHGGS
jgi:hypothetical protein